MDYEKAYKASLKTAAQWIKDGCTDKEKICLECVFPELRESEDERIRKLLVWQVYRNIEDETNDLAQSVYDGIKGHDPDIEESIEDWKKCLAYLEKQKDSKVCEAKSKNFTIQTSEEKEYIRTIKSLISDFIRDKQPEDVTFYQKIYDWLEGRHVEQKPAGWSKEDEKMRLRAVEYISGLQDDYLEDWEELHPGVAYGPITSYDEVLDWLKSLRPSWKPSEEQMEALRKAVNKLADTEVADSVRLSIMYDHLKELV